MRTYNIDPVRYGWVSSLLYTKDREHRSPGKPPSALDIIPSGTLPCATLDTVAIILLSVLRTLIDSTPGVNNAWGVFAKDYGLNAEEVAHATHGRRLYDTLKEFCGVTDEAKLSVRTLDLRPLSQTY